MPDKESPDVRALRLPDGARMFYREFGDRSGPLAIVTPGLSDGLAPLFHPPAAAAVQRPPRHFRRYRVLVASHRDDLPADASTEMLAADLANFIEAVGGPAAVVVGHSMGGMVAQHLAADGSLADRYVMSSTLARSDEVFSTRLEAWDRMLRDEDWQAFYRDAIDASFTGAGRWRRRLGVRLSRPDDPAPDLVERHLRLSAACRAHDATGKLGDIEGPVLVMSGRRDVLTRTERTRELAARIPDATFVGFDSAGHGLPEERPHAYGRALADFLRGVAS